VFISVILYQ